MAKGDKLVLQVGIYDQPVDDKIPPTTERRTLGETFKARSDEEYDRLIEIEAAVDPQKKNELAREEAERKLAALESEREALEAQIEDTKAEGDPSSLTKPELVTRLEEAGLDTEGTKAELAARYQAHLASQE